MTWIIDNLDTPVGQADSGLSLMWHMSVLGARW